MSTNLRWKSLDLMYTMFRRTLWKFPFRWDLPQQKYLSSFSRHDWITFYLSEGVLIILQGVLIPAAVLIRQIVSPAEYVTTLNLLCCLSTCIVGSFSCLISLSIVPMKDETAFAFNQLATLDNFFEDELDISKFSPNVDFVGIFMNGLALSFSSLAFLMPIFSVLNTDTFYHAQRLVVQTSNTSPTGLVLLVFRGILTSIGFLGGVRVFLTIFLNFILALKIVIRCVSILLESASLVNNLRTLDHHHSLYGRLQVIMSIVQGLVAPACLGMMGLGLLVAVTFNFASLRMYGIVPMPIFLFYPVVALIVPFLVHILLPEGTWAFDGTNAVIQNWSYTVRHSNSKDQKYILKKLRSIRPCGIYCGVAGFNFYVMQNSTKSTYYWIMLEYTIDVLLSIPQSAIDSTFA